jgi:hypothetical protein
MESTSHASIVFLAETNAIELEKKKKKTLLSSLKKTGSVSLLDSLVVHLGTLHVRSHWVGQVPEFSSVGSGVDVQAFAAVT